MFDPAFTILLPVTRPPDLIGFAIESVLNQTRPDFELFIVCDGAPPQTVAAAHAFAQRDVRVTVFSFEKGQRHGEAHRHAALQHARGNMVCQIGDDDLWFPDHLAEMAILLEKVEFGNTLTYLRSNETHCELTISTLDEPIVRKRMLEEKFNIFGPTVSGYLLSTYQRLPVGWSPAPPDIWTDLAMWRKFLALPNLVAGSRQTLTALQFPASTRRDWPVDRRRGEIGQFMRLMESEAWREAFRNNVMQIVEKERDRVQTLLEVKAPLGIKG
jgi:glycosyltransferase involved in cell wall biosynthesis